MKFSNGCWLQKKGTECFSPAQVYDVKITDKEVRILTTTHHINHRGDTLGGVNLTICVTAPAKEVLRIQTHHYMGGSKKLPEFELNLSKETCLECENTENSLIIQSGTLKLVVQKSNALFTYYRENEKITSSGWRDLAYMKTDWKGLAYDDGGEEDTYMREQLTLSVGELVYGLGERFTPFVKNGQSLDIWNEDGGTSTEQSYKNIPFYITNKGYGVFVNHPEKVSFEIASEMVTKVGFSVPGECLDYFIINGPDMKQVLARYTDLTGKPGLPAPWTFGLWLSTSFTTNYDEATVNSFVDGMLERGISLGVFHFDCFWMKDFCWSDFTWDSRVFPDPKNMLSRLKAKGLKICVWINSYIGQESVLFEEGIQGGYFLKRKNGDVWQWDMWQPGMAIVDFTNETACKWFGEKLEALLTMGVDCFKTDFGERIPTEVVYYDGSDPNKMHNYYTYLYNKTVYDVLVRCKGKEEAILFARSATAGGQKFPVHWGGDCWSDYESMEESLRGGLSLTMSGFGYWSHDIGGFESTSTPDVYKRWAAFGLLSTHSRLHGSTSYRVPWAYDEEAVDVVRYFTQLKASLMPYLYRNAIETSQTGVPMMRSMVLEYAKDPNCSYLDKQYFLGDSLLVAPIFNEDSMAQYYLPSGRWTNYLTDEVREGGRWYEEKQDYLSIPLYVKPGSIIASGPKDQGAVYDYTEELFLKVYELLEGVLVTTTVYEKSGREAVKIFVTLCGGKITCNLVSNSPVNIVLKNYVVSNVEGAEYKVVVKDTVITANGSGIITATLA